MDIYNDNPLDSKIVCYMNFTNGDIRGYVANVITKNILAWVNKQLHTHETLEYIINHKIYGSHIEREDMYVTSKNGQHYLENHY